MTLQRLVFKTHKWLAVSAGIFTLLWFGSGVVMVLPRGVLGASRTAAKSAAPDYKGITITVPQAIAAAEAAASASVVTTGVDLREIEGRLFYMVSTAKSGTHLIDAVSGTRLEITEDYAKQMAVRMAGGNIQPREMTLVRRNEGEYMTGTLPAYRFDFDDAAATVVYVSKNTGEMSANDRKGRLRGFITGAHTFEFLRAPLGGRIVRAMLILFSFAGLCMSVFGGWILLIQFQNWRARRTGRTVTA